VAAVHYFSSDYEERATLRDGTEVVLRMVRPDDKDLLRRGFLKLSPQSRYLRFFTPKLDLSQDELRYLTEVDGEVHVAIGAVRADGTAQADDASGDDEGLGVARFVRLADEPAVAEAAIALLDDVQGKGLGSLLFLRLVAAARERGIERFRCEILGSNRAMQDFLFGIAAERTIEVNGGVMSIEFALPDVEVAQPAADLPRESSLYKFFTLLARGALDWRDAVARLAMRRRDVDPDDDPKRPRA